MAVELFQGIMPPDAVGEVEGWAALLAQVQDVLVVELPWTGRKDGQEMIVNKHLQRADPQALAKEARELDVGVAGCDSICDSFLLCL